MKEFGCNRFASLKVENGQLVGDLASTFEAESQDLLARFEAKDGDLILLVMAKKRRAQEALGHLRIEVAKALDSRAGVWVQVIIFGFDASLGAPLCLIHFSDLPPAC